MSKEQIIKAVKDCMEEFEEPFKTEMDKAFHVMEYTDYSYLYELIFDFGVAIIDKLEKALNEWSDNTDEKDS